ncbi:MAG: sialidase family protein [Actinomycetota bacterium]
MRRVLVAITVMALGPLWAFPSSAGPLTATAPVQVTGASPFDATCGLDPVDENSVVFLDSEVEPWVDVSPANADVMAGIWQQDRWNDGGARGNVIALSTDGGLSWEIIIPPNITACTENPAAASGDFEVFDRASDPWLSFAPNGDLHLMHLVFDVELPEGLPGAISGRNGMVAQKAPAAALADGVITDAEWEAPILLALDEGGDLHDKNTMTADPTVPAGTHVYAVWDILTLNEGAKRNPDRGVFGGGLAFKGAAVFTRSTDGGATWEPVRVLYDPGAINQTIGNQIVVLPNGTLVDVFNEILNFRNDDGGPQFDFNVSIKRSMNKGVSWRPAGRPIRAAKMLGRTLFTPFPFVGVYDPDVTGNATLAGANAVRSGGDVIPEVAVDPNNGNLYAVWQDARFSAAQAPGGFSDPTQIIDEVAFTMSTNGGLSWSPVIKVNQTPVTEPLGDRQAFTPMVRVNDHGVVAVSYYDFRNNTSTDGIAGTDQFAVHCHAACSSPASWTPANEVLVTTAPFDLRELPFARGYFPGDYVGFGTDGEDFLPFFTQSTATDPANEYFSRVTVGP